MYIVTRDAPLLGAPPSIDVARAVNYNRSAQATLGWGAHRCAIYSLLGLSYATSEAGFAQAVARWQQDQGLTADGMLGPITWGRMQPLLAGRLAGQRAGRTRPTRGRASAGGCGSGMPAGRPGSMPT